MEDIEAVNWRERSTSTQNSRFPSAYSMQPNLENKLGQKSQTGLYRFYAYNPTWDLLLHWNLKSQLEFITLNHKSQVGFIILFIFAADALQSEHLKSNNVVC